MLYCQLAASTHHGATSFSSSAPLVCALGAVTWSIPSLYKGEGAEAPGVVDSVAERAIERNDEGFSSLFHQGLVCEAG
jgi:hypothetical protein